MYKLGRGKAVGVLLPMLLAMLLLLSGCGKTEDEGIGYEVDAEVITDQNELQEAYDAMTSTGTITLEYSNLAVSTDGKTVTCYIGNSPANQYDMYFGVYGDIDCTDELFLSRLLRPGTALKEITLNRELEPGDYTIYICLTQVEDVDGEQTIHSQFFHTIDLQVRDE